MNLNTEIRALFAALLGSLEWMRVNENEFSLSSNRGER